MKEPVAAIFTNEENVFKDLKVLLINLGYSHVSQSSSIHPGALQNSKRCPELCLFDADICPPVPTKELRAVFQLSPSIIFSGTEDSKKIIEYFRAGIFDYILITEKEKLEPDIKRAQSEHRCEEIAKENDDSTKKENIYLHSLITANPDPIFVIDNSNRIIGYNAAASEITGGRNSDLSGLDFTSFFTDRNQVHELIAHTLKGEHLKDIELEIQKRDGGLIPVAINSCTYCDQNGKKSGVFISARDVTERNTTLLLLEEQGAKLEETNKELEAFCYSVSHDLRAPLRIIEGFGRMLLEKCSLEMSPRTQDYVERILSSSAKMQDLIEDLLRLSRVNRVEITVEEVNLTKMVKGILDDLKNHEPERSVKCTIAEGVFGRGDRALFAILFQNLLDNAWKYTKKTENAEIEFGVKQEIGIKRFFIRDNGAGFKASSADQLYIPFKRYHTESEFPGTGIGLATVKRIITRLGGTITADSEPGKGACFSFTLGA